MGQQLFSETPAVSGHSVEFSKNQHLSKILVTPLSDGHFTEKLLAEMEPLYRLHIHAGTSLARRTVRFTRAESAGVVRDF